jgi:hypothetical protein
MSMIYDFIDILEESVDGVDVVRNAEKACSFNARATVT